MAPTLKATNLQKRLGGRVILQSVCLECAAGEVLVVAGANGSGKSTLLRVLSGILVPDRGEVEVCGLSLLRDPVRAKACLGYAPDGLEPLPDLLVSEFLSLVCALKANRRVIPPTLDPALSARVGVAPLAGQRLVSLSFGQRKRVTLLAALIGAPELLLLDEPTNGIDPEGIAFVRELIAERCELGLSTVLSSNDAEFLTTLHAKHHVLDHGKLVDSTSAS